KKEKEASERVRLATALARVGDRGPAAAALLEEALKVENRWDRERALKALGEMGPGAASVLPELKKALRDEDDRMRRWIAFAVWRIGRRVTSGNMVLDERRDAVAVLSGLVRQPDRAFGLFGVTQVVNELGAEAAPLVPAYVAVLKKSSRETPEALEALA